MQFWHKFISSPKKCVNDVIRLKLIISNIIKVVEFLSSWLSSWISMKVIFVLPQIAQFDESINLFCLFFLTLEFSFTKTDIIRFHCYLLSGNIFLTINFIDFDFIISLDLNSNPNNLVEVLFISVFLVNCLMSINISLIVPKILKSSLSGLILANL